MALIEKQVVLAKKEKLSVRLDPRTVELLERYAAFIESSLHYVIEQSLAYTFRKDREFQDWLERTGTTAGVSPAESRGASKEPPPKFLCNQIKFCLAPLAVAKEPLLRPRRGPHGKSRTLRGRCANRMRAAKAGL